MSANDAKTKILSLDDYRQQQLKKAAAPPPFDPKAVEQRITRAMLAPSEEERQIAMQLVLEDAQVMLRALAVMAGEIAAFRRQVKALAQQSADTATINSVLLAHAGGEVRMSFAWFRDYEVPTGAGFMVNEDGDEVVIRAIVVDAAPDEGVPSKSANEQTEDHSGAD